RLCAVGQGATDLGDDDIAHHHRPAGQRFAQRGLGRIRLRGVAQQLDDDGGVDGDHLAAGRLWPRTECRASSTESKPSSLNFPRTREMASSTFLLSTMRLPSSSTLSWVPLTRPSASRTALGSVIWPRSATVASMAGVW